MNRVCIFLKKVPAHIFVLIAIIAVGMFVRLFDFHNLLDFGSDQANDATRVSAVLDGEEPWPYYGPDMSKSGNGAGGRENRFRLGPMYYYFQIVSAEIFGGTPDAMAYPDALFSVLALPLFYYFVRRYFSVHISLALTALYATSFYSLTFSHSAWNPNSLPFFSLLLLLSLWNFLVYREAVSWWWAVGLGVALGVGTQLHAITLALFPATAFCVFVFLLRRHWRMWPKWILAFALLLVLNLGQIIGEFHRDFKNTQTFFISAANSGSDDTGRRHLLHAFAKDVSCHIEANAYIVSSMGDGNCDYWLVKSFQSNVSVKVKELFRSPAFLFGWVLSIAFSVFGYTSLVMRWWREREASRKHFLGIVLLFLGLSFWVLFPILAEAFRYFVHTFFAPLLFVGFFMEYVARRFPRWQVYANGGIIVLAVAMNLFSLRESLREGGIRDRLVLGQAEAILATMHEFAGQDMWRVMVTRTVDDTYRTVRYLADRKGWSTERLADHFDAPVGMPVIYMTPEVSGDPGNTVKGNPFEIYRSVGGVTLYKLK